MKTYYLKFRQVHMDAVWGMEASCVTSHLIRCTRNRLRKSVFEWVCTGRQIQPTEMAYYRKHYPLTVRMDLHDGGNPR